MRACLPSSTIPLSTRTRTRACAAQSSGSGLMKRKLLLRLDAVNAYTQSLICAKRSMDERKRVSEMYCGPTLGSGGICYMNNAVRTVLTFPLKKGPCVCWVTDTCLMNIPLGGIDFAVATSRDLFVCAKCDDDVAVVESVVDSPRIMF